MAFYDVRLLESIERGAVGGPGFKTTILTISSGAEKRNIDWQRSRGKWNISYGLTQKSEVQNVIDMFWVANGRANGFRFKDWSDFQIGDTIGGDTSTKQSIGTGDGTVAAFQIYKLYSIGVASYQRPIFKPVQGTLRVFVAGAEWTANEGSYYTANYNSGLITFNAGHLPGTLATNTLQIAVNPAANETVTIGSITYKWVTALSGAANEVLIGATVAASINNLVAAVNGSAGAGSVYGTGTAANTAARAAGGVGQITFTAIAPFGGPAGNSIVATETMAGAGNQFTNANGFLNGGALADVSVMVEFDVPVRFDSDDLQINAEVFSSEAIVEIPQINLYETRDID